MSVNILIDTIVKMYVVFCIKCVNFDTSGSLSGIKHIKTFYQLLFLTKFALWAS